MDDFSWCLQAPTTGDTLFDTIRMRESKHICSTPCRQTSSKQKSLVKQCCVWKTSVWQCFVWVVCVTILLWQRSGREEEEREEERRLGNEKKHKDSTRNDVGKKLVNLGYIPTIFGSHLGSSPWCFASSQYAIPIGSPDMDGINKPQIGALNES